MSQTGKYEAGQARGRSPVPQPGNDDVGQGRARSSMSGPGTDEVGQARGKANSWLRTSLLATVTLALLVGLSLSGSGDDDAGAEEPELASPLPSALPACRLRGEAALGRAKGMEALADASWERLPFALEDAPKAVLYMAEAESCYRTGFDREGRQRAEAKRKAYEAELLRRWSRAQLSLELSRRRGERSAARREIARLRALSSRAGPEGEPYRQWLERMDRAAQARAAETQAKED